MAKRRHELDTRVFTIFLLIAIPFVAFGSIVVVTMARGALHDSVGQSLEQRAFQTKLLIERYVADQVVMLRMLAADPQVHDVLAKSARDRSDEAARLEHASKSPLAERLRGHAQIRPGVIVIHAVDAAGRLAATSGRMGPVDQADADWFRALAQDEQPEPFVGDIHKDASGQGVIEIAYPVYGDDGQWLGGVQTVLESADLYSVLAPVRVGRTGHAELIHSKDGLILASDNSARELSMVYPGFSAIQAAIRERRGYWIIPEVDEAKEDGSRFREPARMMGYARVDQVPNAEWCVVVEQELSEANAPIRMVTRYLWIHFIGAFGTVILLALYFSFKLETPVLEEELHLHEEHIPPSMKTEASAAE
jgi:hypothetical protein